jgi:hypothetical protein
VVIPEPADPEPGPECAIPSGPGGGGNLAYRVVADLAGRAFGAAGAAVVYIGAEVGLAAIVDAPVTVSIAGLASGNHALPPRALRSQSMGEGCPAFIAA